MSKGAEFNLNPVATSNTDAIPVKSDGNSPSKSNSRRIVLSTILTPILLLGQSYLAADVMWYDFSPLRQLHIAYSPVFDYTPIISLFIAIALWLRMRKRSPLLAIVFSLLIGMLSTQVIIFFPLTKVEGLQVRRYLTKEELASVGEDVGFSVAQPRMGLGEYTLYIAKDRDHLELLKAELARFKDVLPAP